MKNIYDIIEENCIEKTDEVLAYASAYQKCFDLVNEKFEFPDFKSMFGSKKQTVSNSASSGFSFLSFLLGGNTNTKNDDPVKAAYMKTLEQKRANNDRRRKEMLKAN